MDRYHQCQTLLAALEVALRQAGLWDSEAPEAAALASREPFAVDTLSCQQWLQWIFVPRMNALLRAQAPLPGPFAISPYVEETLKEHAGCEAVLAVTRQLDALFGAGHESRVKS